MTTIIAKKNPKTGAIDIGWDSQATAGIIKYHSNKVVEVNGQFHLGTAGSCRYGDILEYADVPRIHEADFETDFDVRGWIITKAIPAWIHALKESEKEHLDKEDWTDGMALIVMKGRIFIISSDYSVTEFPEQGGVGSGAYYARGAMAAGASVEKALGIAAEMDPFTGGKLNVLKGLK